jgi:excisionase family DNA binding protein
MPYMRLLRAEEVAEVLGVAKCRVYDLVRAGLLPAVHLGRQIRIDEEALRNWVRNGGQAWPGGWRREA